MRTLEPHAAAHKDTVVAVGVFDGVHLGHQELLRAASRISRDSGLPLLALTFAPHPRTLTGTPNGYERLLTPPDEKSELFADAGSDYLLVLPFTRELASTPPRIFAGEHLAARCRAKHVVCGFNFTFGYKGAGTPHDLASWGAELGFAVSVVPPLEVRGIAVSSTRIRSALMSGDPGEAWACLGRPYCVTGVVAPGDGRGKKIGVPTSNLALPPDKMLPANGVYAAYARVKVEGIESILTRPAVVNVGTRPTFGGDGVRVEAHIPGFDGDLYGRAMQVLFLERLRNERRFDNAGALLSQVGEDAKLALAACQKARSFTLPVAYDRMLALNLP